jgi:hypothetical protein
VLEVFSPSMLEQTHDEGDYEVMKIGPWWLESEGSGPHKNYILSLDFAQDLEESLSRSTLQINGSYLTAKKMSKDYLLIKPGTTITYGDVMETEQNTREYQEWKYRIPTTEELTEILSQRN